MENFMEIITTSNDKGELEKISEHLVVNRLAACVQISGPVTSCYMWESVLEKTEEWECRIKSITGNTKVIMDSIKKMHSYDVPQIITIPIIGGSKEYLAWVKDSVKK